MPTKSCSSNSGGNLLRSAAGEHPAPSPMRHLGDDLLLQILILVLELRSVFRCKSVCKRWNSLISDPYFSRRFSSHHKSTASCYGEPPLLPFNDPESTLSFIPVPHELKDRFVVMDSFKDLLLCGFVDSENSEAHRSYIVCNPFSKQWIALPLVPKRCVEYEKVVARLVCEPVYSCDLNLADDDGDGCPQGLSYSEYRFCVVRLFETWTAGYIRNTKLDVFCSESGRWKTDALVLLDESKRNHDAFSSNGNLYWVTNSWKIVVCNPFRLDITPPTFISVLPIYQRTDKITTFSTSQGALHMVLITFMPTVLRLLTLEEDGTRYYWRKRYKVALETLMPNYELDRLVVDGVVGLHPEKPEIVFLQFHKICVYSGFHERMGSIETPPPTENGTSAPTSADANSNVEQGSQSATDAMPSLPGDAVPMETNGLKERRGSTLPLEVGTRVMCRWRDSKYHPVKVIERRKVSYSGVSDYEYYVHYTEFNRRLDEWVKLDQLDLDSVEAVVDEKVEDKVTSLKMTRHQKRKIDETHVEGHEELDAASLREHEEFTKVKNIATMELGKYEIETWYFSPFPPEYNDCLKLYFCEFCLNFMKRKEQLQRHMRKCDLKHPPGDEIYRSGTLSMFEVDGKRNKVYGQNLCYLAKLFLDHKTLYYDVDLFLFYVLCECDDRGCHMVGYFSKEKHSEESYNLACILTLPPYQRKGYGKFLIAFSYELSKKEGKVGTPERPLSDLGLVSYRGYWTRVLLDILKKHKGNISIKELSDMTAIKVEDILTTLQSLELIQYRKGQHVICADPKVLDRHLKAAGRGGLDVDASKLIWTPYKEQS
ncbi:unnamed protein product [Linum tenue]|uniref:Histone acetyltransferase n=1 Tax=Linum tenue TaxID=586396 RepID=A0AAV0IHV3_9ROSI|nr:unnamed protein product [Linum tenue]